MNSLVTYGKESSGPLTELEAEYKSLNIEIARGLSTTALPPPEVIAWLGDTKKGRR